MKNKSYIFLAATLTFTALYNMPQINKSTPFNGRNPASQSPEVDDAKKAVTADQMKDMKEKLQSLKDDLINNVELLEKRNNELETAEAKKQDERVEKLRLMILEQKKQIIALSNQIKGSAVIKDLKQSDDKDFKQIFCQAKSQQKKLEEEMEKLLKDKEAVVKQIATLKEEKEEIKKKVKPESAKKEVREEDELNVDNKQMIALMSAMTNMFLSQQQAQSQMQNQMFTMQMPQMQYPNMNFGYGQYMANNPYMVYGNSFYNPMGYQYSYNSNFNQFPTMQNDIFSNSGVGIGVNMQQNSFPLQQMERQPSSIVNQYQFGNNEQALQPQIRYYNFNRTADDFTLKQPELNQMQKVNM